MKMTARKLDLGDILSRSTIPPWENSALEAGFSSRGWNVRRFERFFYAVYPSRRVNSNGQANLRRALVCCYNSEKKRYVASYYNGRRVVGIESEMPYDIYAYFYGALMDRLMRDRRIKFKM